MEQQAGEGAELNRRRGSTREQGLSNTAEAVMVAPLSTCKVPFHHNEKTNRHLGLGRVVGSGGAVPSGECQ